MQDILVLGAGKIGALISGLLAESGDYRVQLADRVAGAADEVRPHAWSPRRNEARYSQRHGAASGFVLSTVRRRTGATQWRQNQPCQLALRALFPEGAMTTSRQ